MNLSLHSTHGIALFALLSTISNSAASTSTITHLPSVQIKAAKVDAAGNIYLAGQTTASAAYVAKLNPDGTMIYTVSLGGKGSSSSAASALDIDSDGAAYIAGTTTATDFPVSAGAVQSTGATAFAAKLDAKGSIVYTALIGGKATTQPFSIVVNTKHELIVSGQATTNPPSEPNAFLLKLSANATQVVSGPPGVGGLVITDTNDNIYVAGYAVSDGPAATPGAFQAKPDPAYCGCPLVSFPCGSDQFVVSLTGDLRHTRFLTYVTAKRGAAPAYIALDAQGNVLIAGTTSAPGYPTTPNSYEPNYTAASGIDETCGPPVPLEFTSASGYVTLIKADGSGLIFSTFFSGSNYDTLVFAALTNAGIYLGGQAGSADLPGFDGAVPSACLPDGFVTRMTLDGSAVSASRTPPGTPLAYDSTNGTLLLVFGNDLLRFDPSAATPIACVLDAADLSPVTMIAPGELLSMFGRFTLGIDPDEPAVEPSQGSYPVNFQGLEVVANQTPTPLLYVSDQQINFQTPYETPGSLEANLTLTYSDINGDTISDSIMLQVAASNPVAFLAQPSMFNVSVPVALNADGTINSEAHPASLSSIVTIFVDGLGVTDPAPITGRINSSPAPPLDVSLTVTPAPCGGGSCFPGPTFVSAAAAIGSISGVTQVKLRAPTVNPYPGSEFQTLFSLTAGGTAVRDMNLSFWVK
jgi:uncharacterized protein (TIGR03437 family)